MPGPRTYVVDMHQSKRRRIRLCCLASKRRRCSCVVWGWSLYNIVESESDPLTRRAVDLFEKEPLKGNSEVHLHTPTKFGKDPSKDLGGDREQTDRQTDKRCSIYSMTKKNPSRAIPRSTYIHPPSLAKIRQRTSEEIGNKQTDKQTNAARFIVWFVFMGGGLTCEHLLALRQYYITYLQSTVMWLQAQ